MLLNSCSERQSEQPCGIGAEAGRPVENSKPTEVVGEVFRGNTLEADHPCAQARTKGIDVLHMPSALYGTFKNLDGGKIIGEWRDGKPTGQATYAYKNGDRYVGAFKDGQFSGKGIFTLSSGKTFEGEWREGKLNGQGTLKVPDGGKYAGNFKDGEFNGLGTYTWANGATYTGEWISGLQNGLGKQTSPDGPTYVGIFKAGRLNGEGEVTFPKGMKYRGEFKDQKFNGVGTLYSADGSILRSGNWQNGEFIENQRSGAARGGESAECSSAKGLAALCQGSCMMSSPGGFGQALGNCGSRCQSEIAAIGSACR